jgi:phosphopantothenoylcysteine decarboxylase / phosphopantothenate---cysteine ligase
VKRVVLIIGGGIAAYKCLDLIRRLRERKISVRVILTKAAREFVTPLAVGALSNEPVFSDLFDLDDEREIGHIRLARDTDLIVVAPATADLLGRMASGLANDLATAVLLATRAPVLAAPAMNPAMWSHPATRRNAARLAEDGIQFIGPNEGEMAEQGEAGFGRMAEADELANRIDTMLAGQQRHGPASQALPLAGRHVLVTSGPTHEPIDPVRMIVNRSSGKQGHALAAAAARLGARVTLVSGPVALPDPSGVDTVHVETAREMLAAATEALPADIAVFAAAVADWRVAKAGTTKLKKAADSAPPRLTLKENPDILKTIAALGPKRPALVIGFAAETSSLIKNAKAKRKRKGAEWIVANDVSTDSGVFGSDHNRVYLVTEDGEDAWPAMTKADVADRLLIEAARYLAEAQISV